MTFAPFASGRISLANDRVSRDDSRRQESAAGEILKRLDRQPGVVLADEVGMGKTFVAMAVAASVILDRPAAGPVVVMVPSSLKYKWPKDWLSGEVLGAKWSTADSSRVGESRHGLPEAA